MSDTEHPTLSREEFRERVTGLLVQESTEPIVTWWLSFAGEEGFRGVLLVEARGLAHALLLANRAQVNPHGEVRGYALPPDVVEAAGMGDTLRAAPRLTLLSRADLDRLGLEPATQGELDAS